MSQPFRLFSLLLLTSLLAACSGTQEAMRQPTEAPASAEQLDSKRDYDAKFATEASSSHTLAVALGKLAQQKGIVQEVKDWGRQITTQHTQADEQLRALARRSNIAVPEMMSSTDRAHYDDVDDRKYLGFDKKFLRALKEANERDLKLYTEASTKAGNSNLRAFAADMLPTLYQQQQTTEELYERADERK